MPPVKRFSERVMLKELASTIAERLLSGKIRLDTDDDDGEILIATSFYRNIQGGIQDQPDPEWLPEQLEDEQEDLELDYPHYED